MLSRITVSLFANLGDKVSAKTWNCVFVTRNSSWNAAVSSTEISRRSWWYNPRSSRLPSHGRMHVDLFFFSFFVFFSSSNKRMKIADDIMSSSKRPSAMFYIAQGSGFSICANFNSFRKFVTKKKIEKIVSTARAKNRSCSRSLIETLYLQKPWKYCRNMRSTFATM